jgi:hypothetical protein
LQAGPELRRQRVGAGHRLRAGDVSAVESEARDRRPQLALVLDERDQAGALELPAAVELMIVDGLPEPAEARHDDRALPTAAG